MVHDKEAVNMRSGKSSSDTTVDFNQKTISINISLQGAEDDTIELLAVELHDVLLKFGFRAT